MDTFKNLRFPSLPDSLHPFKDFIVRHKWQVGVTVFIGVASWKLLTRKTQKLPPGPKGWPLIGLPTVFDGDFTETMKKLHKEYGDIVYVPMPLGTGMVLLMTHKSIKEAFVTSGSTFNHRSDLDTAGLKFMAGADEIFCAPYNDQWRADKKFAAAALRQFGSKKGGAEDKIISEMSLLVEKLKSHQNEAVNIDSLIRDVSANIIHSIIFNERFDHDDPRLDNFKDIVKVWFQNMIKIGEVIYLPVFLLYLIYPRTVKRALEARNKFVGYVKTKIEEHKVSFDPDNIRDFTDAYLNARLGKEDCDWDKIICTILMFLPDAVDTLGHMISYVVLMLARNPDSQHLIQKQIDSATGNYKDVLLEHKSSIPALESFILECSRYANTIATTATHTCVQDATLSGYDISKGTMVLGMLENAMHDENDFQESSVFKPTRFLDDDGQLHKAELWIPFGMGRRMCMGEQVSKMEMFLVTANLLKNFSFKLEDPKQSTKLITGVIRQPPPYKVILTAR